MLFGSCYFLFSNWVGKVNNINTQLLIKLCADGTIPVIASVAKDKAGGKLNVNADSAAGKVAAGVRAEKLVVVSDTHGIRTDIEDEDSWVSSLNEAQIKEMIDYAVSGKVDDAAAIHHRLLSLVNALFIVSNPIPIKYALNHIGFNVGNPRLPLTEPDEKSADLIKETLRNYRIDLSA